MTNEVLDYHSKTPINLNLFEVNNNNHFNSSNFNSQTNILGGHLNIPLGEDEMSSN